MSRETKKRRRRDILTIIALLCILVLTIRFWPILMLMILGLFSYALWMLVQLDRKPEPPQQPILPALPAAPATAESVISDAFGILQHRITEQVTAFHPTARWVWDAADARMRFAAGEPLFILLNRAGGYRRAMVRVCNLQFCGLVFPIEERHQDPVPEETEYPPAEPDSVDYGLLAFEWVDANMQELNGRSNEMIAQGQDTFRILAADLPHADSWHDICKELLRNGFTSAEALADGIEVQIKIN